MDTLTLKQPHSLEREVDGVFLADTIHKLYKINSSKHTVHFLYQLPPAL